MADAPRSIIARVRSELMNLPGVRRAGSRKADCGTRPEVPLDEFVALLYEEGSAYKLSKRIGVASTNILQRMRWIEEKLGVQLPRGRPEVWKDMARKQTQRIQIENGTIIVGSDLHCWPEIYGAAMAAYVDLHRRLKPDFSILNGDGLDGARIGRHARIGWEAAPTTKEELDALSDFLDQVHKASPNTRKKRTRGNHDDRFDTYLSGNAAEIEGIRGTSLADHLPGWEVCTSIEVNQNLVIKHRHRSGIHVTWNNVRDFGCHIVTGHTHRQGVRPWTNHLGTWYGVDAGMLAPVKGPQFGYTEEAPTDWRSGFVVLTIRDGRLMPPDLVTVTDEERGEVYFRGETLRYEL